MLSAFISKASVRKYPWQAKPRIVICIPCGATSVEKRAVFEAAIQAGAVRRILSKSPWRLRWAPTFRLPSLRARWSSTSAAAPPKWPLSRSAALSRRLRCAWPATVWTRPRRSLRDLLGIKIGERTAEVIKIKIGSILPFEDGRERDMIISGQDVVTEQPKEVTIQSEDVRAALQAPSTRWSCI